LSLQQDLDSPKDNVKNTNKNRADNVIKRTKSYKKRDLSHRIDSPSAHSTQEINFVKNEVETIKRENSKLKLDLENLKKKLHL